MSSGMESLPFSQACENNKSFILDVLRRHLQGVDRVLEVGSGTGQHAEFFASALPHLVWQTTDLQENVPALNLRLTAAALSNLPPASTLDVNWQDWGCSDVPAIFSANSLHIMAWESVELFFRGAARHLDRGGLLMVYGPFKYGGSFTSQSNADFDLWLKSRDPASGIRDFEAVQETAEKGGMTILEDNGMPANNQLLVWRKAVAEPE